MAEWQTRTLEVRVSDPRAGSSPVVRTIEKQSEPVCLGCFFKIVDKLILLL